MGDVVAGHVQALLGGVDTQLYCSKRAECTAHAVTSYALKSVFMPVGRAGEAW